MNDSSSAQPTPLRHPVSDETLACRVQAGCADSFNELAGRLQPRLLFVLKRRLPHHADAEDIAQKTLLRAYEKIALYNSARKFSPWLFTIALRLAADYHRQPRLLTHSTENYAEAIADPTLTPEQQAIGAEAADDIWALAQRVLTTDQWTALWLLYGEGQSVKEIAAALGRTNVSVRVLLFRARKMLTPHLAKYSRATDNETSEFVDSPLPQIAKAES